MVQSNQISCPTSAAITGDSPIDCLLSILLDSRLHSFFFLLFGFLFLCSARPIPSCISSYHHQSIRSHVLSCAEGAESCPGPAHSRSRRRSHCSLCERRPIRHHQCRQRHSREGCPGGTLHPSTVIQSLESAERGAREPGSLVAHLFRDPGETNETEWAEHADMNPFGSYRTTISPSRSH